MLVVVGILFTLTANAATLDLNLEKNITSVKDDAVIQISINSEGREINTSQATIVFPTNLLEVTKVDLSDSIFSFWLQEPIYDNNKGTINFVGGSTDGYNGSALRIMKIYFRVKGSGNGRLNINNAAITASDGTGTNVYSTAKGLDILVPTDSQFQAVVLEKRTEQTTLSQKLPSVNLSVPFYPDSTKWNNQIATFKATWNIDSDIVSAGISLNKNSDSEPVSSNDVLVGNKIFPALEDGIWYLHLRLKNNIGWSPTTHYRIALDTTPPSTFKINSVDGFKTINPTPTISFSSSDLTSGIKNYIIRVDGNIATTTINNTYKFQPLLPGIHNLTVTALDKAGNSISENQTLEILPIDSPVISYVSRSVIVNEGSITAGGTAIKGAKVFIQIQNSQKQTVFEQTVSLDENGNWNILVNKTFSTGKYQLLATTKDKNMSSSFPAVSESITVKLRPMLVIGNIEISQIWFFVDLIALLIIAFLAGWYGYNNWRKQLDRRVTIAQRDVINIFDNIDKDIDELIKEYTGANTDRSNLSQAKNILKNMKNNLDKTRGYVIDNIREIEK